MGVFIKNSRVCKHNSVYLHQNYKRNKDNFSIL